MTDTLYGKLKPCPFCGAPAEMDTRRAYRDTATGALDTAMAIYCTQCTAEKSMCLKDYRGLTTDEIAADLIIGWNRRDADVIVGSGGSTQKVPVEGSAFADILLQKIEVEILDTEGALISSRDAGHWTQHQTLQGHKAGLLWVRNRIKELLP